MDKEILMWVLGGVGAFILLILKAYIDFTIKHEDKVTATKKFGGIVYFLIVSIAIGISLFGIFLISRIETVTHKTVFFMCAFFSGIVLTILMHFIKLTMVSSFERDMRIMTRMTEHAELNLTQLKIQKEFMESTDKRLDKASPKKRK